MNNEDKIRKAHENLKLYDADFKNACKRESKARRMYNCCKSEDDKVRYFKELALWNERKERAKEMLDHYNLVRKNYVLEEHIERVTKLKGYWLACDDNSDFVSKEIKKYDDQLKFLREVYIANNEELSNE